MTKEEFTKIYSENPSSDEVMQEINRLYDEEAKLTADFAAADSEREKLKNDLADANKRYRERFFSTSETKPEPEKNSNPFDGLFKEG